MAKDLSQDGNTVSEMVETNDDEDVSSLLAAAGINGLSLALAPSRDTGGCAARRVIYTAILAGSDILNTPLYVDRSCDYICFTDSVELQSKFWRIVRIKPVAGANCYMMAKAIKVLGADILNAFEESIWMDGSILLKRDPWQLIDGQLGNCDFAFIKHPDRNCVFEEIEACAVQGKDSRFNLESVRSRLIKAGYPQNNGLVSGGFIYRRHQAQVKRLFRDWMRNITEFSRRDQLSFNYTCWLSELSITYIDLDIFNNYYFAVLPHFSTAIGKLKWIRKYVIIWCGEKYDRLAGHILRDRGLSA